METKIAKNKLIIYIFLIVLGLGLVLYFGFNFYLKNQNSVNRQLNNPGIISPTIIKLPGKMIMTYDKKQSTASKMVFEVYASSSSQPISTFDIAIHYNHNKLEYLADESENLIPDFEIRTTDNQIAANLSELIITGIKSTYIQEPILLDNTLMSKIVFKPTAKLENSDIKLFFKPSSTIDSGLLNDNEQDILGEVENPQL